MCDTFVALPPATAEHRMILAKSADCQVNEAFALVRVPRRRYQPGEAFRATHLVIPQAEETYEIIMGRSFWTWGGEMGINEHGVAMGYEAVFTRPATEEMLDGVIAPDLLRLGLERGKTAREAVDIITAILTQYGQGGNCELSGNSHFDGSYLIADPSEAWILETAGRQWVTRRLTESIGSISNFLSIRDEWDDSSIMGRLDWASAYSEPDIVPCLGSRDRQASTYTTLAAKRGMIGARTAFDILRQHEPGYDPAMADVHRDICVHAGPQKYRGWQATGTMVFATAPGGGTIWHTSTAGTCLSIFKPIFLGVELPDMGPLPTEKCDLDSFWWKHELLHRRAMADFPHVMREIREHFDALETEFLNSAATVEKGTASEKRQFMEYCFREAAAATEEWVVRLSSRANISFANPSYRDMWRDYNRPAGLSGLPA